MLKLESKYKKPCNFHSASPQAAAWSNATIESNPELFGTCRLAVFENGVVLKWHEKHVTGVINTRITGGKWDSMNGWIESHARISNLSKEKFLLNHIKQTEYQAALFRAPRKKDIKGGFVNYEYIKQEVNQ
jgi:hypothetical protein